MVKKKEDSPKVRELKHQARRKSIKQGIFNSAKVSFGDYYISPFAIAINMSNSLIAFLGSISGLLGSLTQFFSSRLIEKHSRKKIILISVFLEALMWLPLITIAILFYNGILIDVLPLFFLISFSIYIILANMGNPAWFSWMGDIVDENYRGRWFSKRKLINGFVSMVLAISAAFFLSYFKGNDWTMFGFIILFSLALIARLISWTAFKQQYEPKIKLVKSDYFSIWAFLKQAPKNNFGRFTIFRACLGFTTAISSPLLAIHLLRNLKFSYSTFMIVILAGAVFSILVLQLWGKFADRYGNYRVMGITCVLIPMIPILWFLSPSPIYLILIPSFVSGVSWAGFNLASGNFIYDNVTPQKRGLAISYYNMLIGFGVFFGAGLGAILIKYLTTSLVESIFIIFIIGSVARMIVVFFGLTKVKEIKKTGRFDSSKALKNIIFKHGKQILREEAHEIMSIKKYIYSK